MKYKQLTVPQGIPVLTGLCGKCIGLIFFDKNIGNCPKLKGVKENLPECVECLTGACEVMHLTQTGDKTWKHV